MSSTQVSRQSDWKNAFSYHALDQEFAGADGVFVYDTGGNKYFDVSGGPMAQHIGHGHPRIREAIHKQLDQYAFVHPMLANRPRADLCNALASVTPEGFNASYLVSGGSEGNETAMKIARQYHIAKGNPGKSKIVSNYESYHGMTLGTMSLSGNPRSLRHFDPMIQHWPKVSQYSDYRKPDGLSRDEWAVQVAQELEKTILLAGPETVAAYILTPHGCGPDYGEVAPDRYWQEVRRICDENDVLLIADEVVTGFGRTGKWFGMDHFPIDADIMVFAKGISSSVVPLGAVTVHDRVNEPFENGTTFVHGFTNAGNALACAAGLASIQIMKDEGLVERSAALSPLLFSFKDRLMAHPTVAAVRGWGLYMAIELVQPGGEGRSYFPPEVEAEKKFQHCAMANGVIVYSSLYGMARRPVMSRGLPLYVAPPLTITESELEEMMERLDRTFHHWEQMLVSN